MSLLPPLATKSAKFETPGTTYSGTLVEIGDEQQASTYDPNGPGKPAYWDDEKTRPKMQRRFLIQCAPDPAIEGDDGMRALYPTVDSKQGGLYHAIYEALKGQSSLGGTLTVTFTGYDPLSKNPQNPRKLYTASYAPGPLLGDGAPAPAPAAPAAPAPAAAQQYQPAPGGPAAAPGWPAAAAAPAAQAPAAAPAAPAPAAPAGPPPGITDAAWAAMDEQTKQAILAANQPPF